MGDYENVISPVVNLAKVKEYGSDYITARSLQNFHVGPFFLIQIMIVMHLSYHKLKKVSSGFQLNLGLFKSRAKEKDRGDF